MILSTSYICGSIASKLAICNGCKNEEKRKLHRATPAMGWQG